MSLLKRYVADLLPVILFVVISLAYFWEPIMGGKVLTGHDHSGGIGAGTEIKEYREQHNGETPRWTNTLFSGMPTYQMAPSYDSTDTLARIKNCYMLGLPDVAAYVFIMLLGFYIMLRCFDFKVWMAALGAVLWAFSSYYFIIIAAGHIWKVFTLAFIPPTIGGMALCYRGKYSLGLSLTGIFMALQIFSNHVQMTYYFLFPISLMAIAWLIQAIKEKQVTNWFKASTTFALGCLLGIAVNASNLYHTWQYSKESMRSKSELSSKTKNAADQTSSGLERSYITMWSYGIGETWTLLVPNAKGGASQPLTQSRTAMDKADPQYLPIYQQLGQYWGDQPGTSGPVYVGALVCFLFVLGLLIVRGPMSWALLIATMLSIALAWGKNFMGLTDLFLDYFPMYDKFRTVASILVIAEFTMPLLAVMALKRYIEDPHSINLRLPLLSKPVNALYISFALTAGISLLFWLTPDLFFGRYLSLQEQEMFENAVQAGYFDQSISAQITENLSDMRRAVFTADALRTFIIISIGLALMLLYKYRKLGGTSTTLAITLLCLIDMWSVNKRYLNDQMFVYPRPVEQTYAQSPADVQILMDPTTYYRTLDLTVSTFNSNDASYWHKSIGGYHAAKLRRYQEVIEAHLSPEMQALQRAIYETQGDLSAISGDSLYPVLDMLNMRYIIAPLNEGRKGAVFNPHALGNAWYVDHIISADNADDELAALSTTDLRHNAVYQPNTAATPLHPQPADSTASIRLTHYSPTQLKYETHNTHDGAIIFSEIYYPGWTCTIDGTPTPIVRANYILRAINCPKGKHEIIMTFDPQSVHTTEAIAYTALTLLLLTVIASLIIRRKKR